MYAENVGQYDEKQLLADYQARLDRRIVAAKSDSEPRKTVLPSGYVPPSVVNAERRSSYLDACNNYMAWHLRRRRNQGKTAHQW